MLCMATRPLLRFRRGKAPKLNHLDMLARTVHMLATAHTHKGTEARLATTPCQKGRAFRFQ